MIEIDQSIFFLILIFQFVVFSCNAGGRLGLRLHCSILEMKWIIFLAIFFILDVQNLYFSSYYLLFPL